MFWTLSKLKTSYFTSPNDAGIQKHTLFTRFHAFECPRRIVGQIWPPWAALGPPGVPSGPALGSPWDVLEPPWAPSGAVGASWVASGGLSGPSKDENQAVRNHGPKGTSRPLRPETPGARCLTASVPTGSWFALSQAVRGYHGGSQWRHCSRLRDRPRGAAALTLRAEPLALAAPTCASLPLGLRAGGRSVAGLPRASA